MGGYLSKQVFFQVSSDDHLMPVAGGGIPDPMFRGGRVFQRGWGRGRNPRSMTLDPSLTVGVIACLFSCHQVSARIHCSPASKCLQAALIGPQTVGWRGTLHAELQASGYWSRYFLSMY